MSASKYQKQATLGLIALGLIASPLFLRLPSQFQTYNAQLQIESREALERMQIQQRKQTADKLAQAGVLPNGQKLKIRNYFDTPSKDPLPETTGWLEDEIVFVYDAAGACIGRIENRQWKWKYKHETACNNVPAM